MKLATLIRWRSDSPGWHTLRTGILALFGGVFLALAAVGLERVIWPHGEQIEAWHGLDVPLMLLIIGLLLLGVVCIPLGAVRLIWERLHHDG